MKPVQRFQNATEEVLKDAETAVKSELNSLGETMRGWASKAEEHGEEAIEETGAFLRRYPTQSLIAGFGAGILLGIFLGRKKSELA